MTITLSLVYTSEERRVLCYVGVDVTAGDCNQQNLKTHILNSGNNTVNHKYHTKSSKT